VSSTACGRCVVPTPVRDARVNRLVVALLRSRSTTESARLETAESRYATECNERTVCLRRRMQLTLNISTTYPSRTLQTGSFSYATEGNRSSNVSVEKVTVSLALSLKVVADGRSHGRVGGGVHPAAGRMDAEDFPLGYTSAPHVPGTAPASTSRGGGGAVGVGGRRLMSRGGTAPAGTMRTTGPPPTVPTLPVDRMRRHTGTDGTC